MEDIGYIAYTDYEKSGLLWQVAYATYDNGATEVVSAFAWKENPDCTNGAIAWLIERDSNEGYIVSAYDASVYNCQSRRPTPTERARWHEEASSHDWSTILIREEYADSEEEAFYMAANMI